MANQQETQRYGKCVIEREIGRGARSIVYLAWHEGLQIPVAIKVMRKEGDSDEQQFSERFMREARIAAQLTHPNMVRVYDCGETEDSYYLVLEYIDGESCKDRMESSGGFDVQTTVQIIREVADGLNYATAKGIIHRDVKPENIMIDKGGNARIADLGLAKEVVPGTGSATADGDVLGTPYYMSPEQVRQPGDVDFRSDIYSLGATMYHMLTGTVPFEAPTPFEIMTMHLNEPLTPPQQRMPDLPEALCDIITRAMAKEPQSRYQSYADLIRDLDSTLAGPQAEKDSFMAPVEQSLDEALAEEGPLVEAAEPVQERLVRPPVMEPRELPVTAHNVRAKAFAVLSLLAYAFFAVCLHQVVHEALAIWAGADWIAAAGATAAMAALVLLSVGLGYYALRPGRTSKEGESTHASEQQLSAALGWVCERLELPTPRVRMSKRADEQCRAYSFFSLRATLHLPGIWLANARLSDREMKAFVAVNLVGVYTGDSDFRTLLAVPVGLLSLVGRFFERLLRVPRLSSRARLVVAHVTAMAVLAGICAAIAVLFFVSIWTGALALIFFGLLLLVSRFERESMHAGDAVAAKVVADDGAVRSLAAVSGLMGLERYRLLHDSLGAEAAGVRWDELPPPEERGELVEGIAAHYSEVAYLPDTLEMARKLFSGLPAAAERLNRLAALPGGRSMLVGGVMLFRRMYAGLLGGTHPAATSMAELAVVRLHAAVGAVAGVLAVLAMAFLFWRPGNHYAQFHVILAAFGVALGLVVAHEAGRERLRAGRLGWGVLVSSVFFTITTMIGFCLAAWPALSDLALQLPVALFVVLFPAAFAAVLFVRVGLRGGGKGPRALQESRTKTHHTNMILAAGEGERPAPLPDEPAPPEGEGPPAEGEEGEPPEPEESSEEQ